MGPAGCKSFLERLRDGMDAFRVCWGFITSVLVGASFRHCATLRGLKLGELWAHSCLHSLAGVSSWKAEGLIGYASPSTHLDRRGGKQSCIQEDRTVM